MPEEKNLLRNGRVIQTKQCKHCWASFDIIDKDLEFYDKISPTFGWKKYKIPSPTLCPDCRHQRRLSFRNERNLYKNTCGKTGKQVISSISPDKEYTIFHQEEWWKDNRNPLDYGIDIDLNKSFFEQFDALLKKVPRPALNVINNENSPYINQCGYTKDSYLCFDCDYSQNCLYSSDITNSEYMVDVLFADVSQIAYESANIQNCYKVFYSFQCKDSNNLYFCYNLTGCNNCFWSVNLRNRSYCFFNQQLSKEEYEEKTWMIQSRSYNDICYIRQRFSEHKVKFFHKNLEIAESENVSGDYIKSSKNAHMCFEAFDSEDVAYCGGIGHLKDTYDFDIGWYESARCLECISSGDKNYNDLFGMNHRGNDSNIIYSDILVNCKNCFGCIWLRGKEFCILNKQYTKNEYETLVSKIIEKMQADGERWEFFHPQISSFGYNETVAMEHSPLSKEEALRQWFKRSDYKAPIPQVEKTLNADELPETIIDVTDDILQQAIICEVSGKPFRIIKQELEFYRKYNLPLPHKHPDVRHIERFNLRNPRKLWYRKCAKCWIGMETTYAPERPEIVYCETCYNKEIYW